MLKNKLMKKHIQLATFLILLCSGGSAQTYTSYFTGDVNDVTTATTYGACLMGGATEHDEAMKWFLNRSGGGDIVVIRVTGTNGYNAYLYSQLGVTVNSVETIVIPSLTAANDPYVRQQLRNAEAIWIAGGDQFDYVSYWKNTAVDSAINDHINIKGAPIGGTSAGMAIQGGHYFSAANGTVTSSQALSDPFDAGVTVGHSDFLHNPFLQDVITDTHYDNPDRKGRHIAFMARIANDLGIRSFGIACDEYTAVCIDENGIAHVYGDYPSYDDNAYFLQANCVAPFTPETCAASAPLTWDRNNAAVKVYAVKGDMYGTKSFSLVDWKTGSGGAWEDWYVVSGQLYTAAGSAPNCNTSIEEEASHNVTIYPNPAQDRVFISNNPNENYTCIIHQLDGRTISERAALNNTIDLTGLANGIYLLELKAGGSTFFMKLIIQK